MCFLWRLTVGVLVGLAVAGGVILDDGPVDAVAQTFVHVDRHLVGDSYEEIHEESALPVSDTPSLVPQHV